MAHGYDKDKKYRGGNDSKRDSRTEQKDSKNQDSRKSHDTTRTNQRPSKKG